MTNSDILTANAAFCVRCARQMHREIQSRLDYGDTNRVAMALERLAQTALLPDVPALLTMLQTCDPCTWLNKVSISWVGARSSWREIATGKSRDAWLQLTLDQAHRLANKSRLLYK